MEMIKTNFSIFFLLISLFFSQILVEGRVLGSEGEEDQVSAEVFQELDYSGNLCIECHQERIGKLSLPVAQWKGSIHHKNSVSCESCHGGDPSSEDFAHSEQHGFLGFPQDKMVPYFCGQCHIAFKEKHLGGPHGKSILPNCIFCHGYHNIQPVDITMINQENCTRCHPFTVPAKMKELILKADHILEKAKEDIKTLNSFGYEVKALEVKLDQAASSRTLINLAFHSYNLGDMSNLVSKMEETSEEIGDQLRIVNKIEERKDIERKIYSLSIPFFVGFALLLFAYKKTL